MIPLSEVKWGPIDATVRDADFSAKWIEPAEIRSCLDRSCWIVTGEKGSGKSAIQRAIREIYSSDYYITPLVDFDKVTFGALYKNLVQLSQTTKLSASVTLSNYWQYSIVIELIRACAMKNPHLYGDILNQEPACRHHRMTLNERLLCLVEEAWNSVAEFTAPGNQSPARANLLASGGLDSNLLHNLSIFPLGQDYEQARGEFFKRIADNGHRVTLILDGFDTLISSDIESSSVHLIFSCLVDAILSLSNDRDLPDGIGIKALIPHDRFMSLQLRDADKVDALHSAIRWNKENLKAFVEKRILLTPRVKHGTFQAVWKQIMPEFVLNSFHKVEEDSFEYILRHTMLRPRQIQIHLATLASAYPGLNIDPSMIPKSIAESNQKLAKFFIDEYGLDHPYLRRMILSFENKDRVMAFKTFREHVATSVTKFSESDRRINIDEAIDSFYVMGLFGAVRFMEAGDARRDSYYYPPARDGKQHYVDFFFRTPDTTISSRLNDDSEVALHPIFADYAKLRPHPTLIIG